MAFGLTLPGGLVKIPNIGGVSASFGTLTGVPGDNAALASALSSKANLDIANTFTKAQTINGGTAIANEPLLNVSQTWNNAAVGFKLEVRDVTLTSTAPFSDTWANNSLMADWRVAGVTKFGFIPRGSENQSMLRIGGIDAAYPCIKDSGTGALIFRRSDGQDCVAAGWLGNGSIGVTVAINGRVGWNRANSVMGGGNSAADTWLDSPQVRELRINGQSTVTADTQIRGQDGAGSNVSASVFRISPGISTGNANPGKLALCSTLIDVSGGTPQTQVDVLTVNDPYTVELADGVNLKFGTAFGTKIGTAADQYISFWGATTSTQPTGNTSTGFVYNGMSNVIYDDATFDGGVGGGQYTINGLIATLKSIGLLG